MSFIVKSRDSIETKIRREAMERAAIRRQEDIHKGLTRSDTAQRGDFNVTKTFDRQMADYRRFKDTKDRERIKNEYFQAQREARRG